MATGTKKPNLAINSGQSWIDSYSITSGVDDIEFLNVGGNDKNFLVGFYTGSGITLSDYDNVPTGSIIFDVQLFKTHYKTAATTWKSSAAAS